MSFFNCQHCVCVRMCGGGGGRGGGGGSVQKRKGYLIFFLLFLLFTGQFTSLQTLK